MRKKLPLSLLVGSFALALLCVVSLGVASFGVPDSVSVFEDGEYPSYPCFSFSERNARVVFETVAVSASNIPITSFVLTILLLPI